MLKPASSGQKQNCAGGRRKRSSETSGEQQPYDLSQVDEEPGMEGGGTNHSRVRLIANQLQASLAESSTTHKSSAESDQVALLVKSHNDDDNDTNNTTCNKL